MSNPFAPLSLTPIGIVRTPYTDRESTPYQPRFAPDVEAEVHLADPYVAGLKDLDSFDRIWLLTWLDRPHHEMRLTVVPPWDTEERGLFAGRGPVRPNSIGLTCCELIRVAHPEDGKGGGVLYVRGVDLLDHTPVLDIKPYLRSIEAHPDASEGWFETAKARKQSWHSGT